LLATGLELSKQLDGWLSAADLSHGPARAIIAPLVIQHNIFFKLLRRHTHTHTHARTHIVARARARACVCVCARVCVLARVYVCMYA